MLGKNKEFKMRIRLLLFVIFNSFFRMCEAYQRRQEDRKIRAVVKTLISFKFIHRCQVDAIDF